MRAILDCLKKEARILDVAIKRESIPKRNGAGVDKEKVEALNRRLNVLDRALAKVKKYLPKTP